MQASAFDERFKEVEENYQRKVTERRKQKKKLLCYQVLALTIDVAFLLLLIIMGVLISKADESIFDIEDFYLFDTPKFHFLASGGIIIRLVIRSVGIRMIRTNHNILVSLKPNALSALEIVVEILLIILINLYAGVDLNFELFAKNFIHNPTYFKYGLVGMIVYAEMLLIRVVSIGIIELFSCMCGCKKAQVGEANSSLLNNMIDLGNADIIVEVQAIKEDPKKEDGVDEVMSQFVKIAYRRSQLGNILIECPICVQEFQDDDMIIPLPCDNRHYFHPRCIKAWFAKSKTCPVCAEPIPAELKQSYRASVVKEWLRGKDKMSNSISAL